MGSSCSFAWLQLTCFSVAFSVRDHKAFMTSNNIAIHASLLFI